MWWPVEHKKRLPPDVTYLLVFVSFLREAYQTYLHWPAQCIFTYVYAHVITTRIYVDMCPCDYHPNQSLAWGISISRAVFFVPLLN